MLRASLLIPVFISICTVVLGQSKVKLKGIVTDPENHPLEYAVVCLVNLKDTSRNKCVLSGNDGSFTILNITEGSYSIKATYLGYTSFMSDPIIVTGNVNDVIAVKPIVLKQAAGKTLNEVAVTARRPMIERKIDRTVINVENSPIAKGNSALDILQSAPGVGESKNGSFALRGKEGTLVLINDKPTYLSAGDLAELLRNTPGSNVQSIELITNPPAKYEAQGTGGIINIRMKTVKSLGSNYSLFALAGYGKYYKWNTGITANFRSRKTNLSVNYIASGNKRFNDQTVERINRLDGLITRFDQEADRVRRIGYNNVGAALDYYLDDKNTIRVFANASFLTAKQTLYNNTQIGERKGTPDSSYESVAPLKSNYSDVRYGLSYERKLDTSGKTLSFDFSGGRYHSKEQTIYNSAYFMADRSALKPSDTLRISSPNIINIYSFKTDYSHPWLNHKHVLDAGLKATYVKTDNDFGYDSLRNGIFFNTIFSNHFVYKENVNAGYANYNFRGNNTSIQLGLRVEQTNSEGVSLVGNNESVKRHYIDFFPSFFVDQKLSAGNVINFAYSRRIDRPSYEDLNPFVYFLDQFTYSQGNPYLKPQYSNSFELNYTLKDKYTASLSYVHIGQVMSEVVKTDPVSKTLIFSYDNLAKENVYSLALTVPMDVTDWWSGLVFFNTNLNHINTPDFYGTPLDKRRVSYNFTVNESVKINESVKFEANFSYQSPYITGTIFYNKPLYNFDLGLSKAVNKNLNISFSVKDVFNTRARYFTSLLPNQQYQYHQKVETRIVRLILSYKFGNTKIPKSTRKPNASEDELRRIKGAN